MGLGLRSGRRLCVCWAKVRLARWGLGECGRAGNTFEVALRTRGKLLVLKIKLNSVAADFKSMVKAICSRRSPGLGWRHFSVPGNTKPC